MSALVDADDFWKWKHEDLTNITRDKLIALGVSPSFMDDSSAHGSMAQKLMSLYDEWVRPAREYQQKIIMRHVKSLFRAMIRDQFRTKYYGNCASKYFNRRKKQRRALCGR